MFYPIFCSQGLNAITSWLPAQSSHIFNGYSDFHIFSMVSLSLHMFDGYTTFSHVLCCYTQCFPYFWWLYTMFPIFLMVWLFRIFIILCFVIPHFSNMPDGYTPCLQYLWCIYIYIRMYIYIPICLMVMPYVFPYFWVIPHYPAFLITILLICLSYSHIFDGSTLFLPIFSMVIPIWPICLMVIPHGCAPW